MTYITYRDTLRRTPAADASWQHSMPAAAPLPSGRFAPSGFSAPIALLETALAVAILSFFGLMIDNTIAGIF
jgi:hypothetical protein